MKLLLFFLACVVLAEALSSTRAPRTRGPRRTRLPKGRNASPIGRRAGFRHHLNSTDWKKMEETLHCNLTARVGRLEKIEKKMWNKTALTVEQQKEAERRVANLPKIKTEKPPGIETVDIFERNELEGTSEVMLQGDIHFTDEQLDMLEQEMEEEEKNSTRSKRQATRIAQKWTNNQVNYYFDAALPQRTRNSVTAALTLITQNTCLNFVQSSTANNRIRVFQGNGCFSNIGMSGREQSLSLGRGCEVIGTAVHEFAHALGMFHTQMRTDRDNFVTINQAAVQPALFSANFAKLSAQESINYAPYEYGSMMHYPASAFASTPGAITVAARDAQFTQTMGGSLTSFYDFKNMNDHYNCGARCASSNTQCQNGGVKNPRNCATCICPAGYGGALCNQRPAGCGETLTATTAWQTKTYSFGDPNDRTNTKDVFALCNHWITAPTGRRISIRVTSLNNGQCNFGCPFNGLEIKRLNQQATNPRICCNNQLNQELQSTLNPTPIISFNRFFTTTVIFQYRYT